jgi:hypothetical protein
MLITHFVLLLLTRIWWVIMLNRYENIKFLRRFRFPSAACKHQTLGSIVLFCFERRIALALHGTTLPITLHSPLLRRSLHFWGRFQAKDQFAIELHLFRQEQELPKLLCFGFLKALSVWLHTPWWPNPFGRWPQSIVSSPRLPSPVLNWNFSSNPEVL